MHLSDNRSHSSYAPNLGGESTPSDKPRGPAFYRVYTLLHYLDQPKCRGDPDNFCRLHHINSYMRGNWVVTKELVEYALEIGLVEREGDKAYRISDKGQKSLPDLRRAYEAVYPVSMARFLDR